MKNKKIIGTITLMLFVIAMFAVQADIKSGGKIDISVVSQEPDPATPGEVIDLRLKAENTGFTEIEDIYVEVVEKYPFSVYTGGVQQEIGSLQALQKDSSGAVLLYKIKVDEEAIEGINYIDVKYKIGESGNWIVIKDIPIRIRTRDIILSIDSIETEPELVSPGKEFEMALTLRNNADSLIREVNVKLDFSSDDVPFAPYKSTGENRISQINARTGKIMKFNLIALPDAEGGVYKIPINISYTDEAGDSYSKQDYISLKISSTPDLLLTIDSSEVKGDVKSGAIVIKITNRGLTNLKLLTAKLLESEDYTLMSEPEVYVGNIDSDDYETVDYELKINSFDKIVELPLEISYMDATNKEYKQELTLELNTNSKGLIATIISGIISAVIRLAVLAGLIYGGYWVYKKKFKKKKRQG